MKKTHSDWSTVIALAGAVLLAGSGASPVRGQKSKPAAGKEAPTTAPALPKIWKSQSPAGHEFRVKVENDLFTAEWINLPPAAAKLGAYIRTECRRVGSRWIGTNRVLLPCAKAGELPGKITHVCPMTLRFEVDEITPERISGRGESLRDFNCETCEVRETGWSRYIWLPKKEGTGNRGQGTGKKE